MDSLKTVKNFYKLIREVFIGVEEKGIYEQIAEKEERISELNNEMQNNTIDKENKEKIFDEILSLESEIDDLRLEAGKKLLEGIESVPGIDAIAGQQAKVCNDILQIIGGIIIKRKNNIREAMSELNSVLYDNSAKGGAIKDKKDELMSEKTEATDNNSNQSYDPLVVDFNDDIYDIDNLENGVYFDLDGDGLKEKTAWASSEDALLAIDIDKNGKVDNGAELLGDDYILKDGSKSKSAIDALKELDENNDGLIDVNDTTYSDILIWKDNNHNGISEENELKHLSDYNIKSININDENNINSNVNSSKIKKTITYTQEINGEEKIGKIAEWDFIKNKIDVKDIDLLEGLDGDRVNRIKSLPNIRALGKIRTLWNEMYLDESDKILSTVESFTKAKTFEEREVIIDNLLLELGDTENVADGSSGAYINAKYVKVIEEFTGSKLQKGNLSRRRARIYKDSYSELKELYYASLLLESDFKDIPNFFAIKDDKLQNISLLNLYTLNEMIIDIEDSEKILKEKALVLKYFNSVGVEGFNDFKDYFANISPEYLDIIAKSNTKIYSGTNNSESIRVYSDDATVLAGDGDDSINATFNGHSGDEYFYGGKGNDSISGGRGSDTYFFNLGDGKDTIYENGNEKDTNVIVFGEGIEKENIIINRINSNDVLIKIVGTDDEITVRGQMGSYSGINKIYFNNGDVLTDIEIKNIANRVSARVDYIEGSEGDDDIDLLAGDDTIYAKSGNDKVLGNLGNDKIYAGDGDDILYGGEGNDTLYGEYGDDILEGGQGYDYLEGYYGDDTYIFNKGDGRDTIREYGEGKDKIKLSEDIKKEDILFKRDGDDLIIEIKNSEDSIRIQNQFSSSNYTIEEIVYGNNKKITFAEMLEATNVISTVNGIFKGSYSDDTFKGSDLDEKIYGYSGNDEFTGNKGNDEVDGGRGDDTYKFNVGDGCDTISDSSGFDTLVLGEGVGLDDIYVNRINSNDIELYINGSSDKITLKGQARYNIIDKIEFINGDVLTGNDIRENANQASEKDDYIEGTFKNDIIKAKGGNDTIHTSYGDDIIEGGEGNDIISAGYGDDIIEGSKGNDELRGNYGNDTYIFSRGDGKDTIVEDNYYTQSTEKDKIIFKDINREDIIIEKRSDYDITLKIKDSEDSITIKNAHATSERIEEIHFADGEILTYEEIMSKPFEYYGDDSDNEIRVYSEGSIVKAGAGNDKINTSTYGDNEIYGEAGDDVIRSGYGKDKLYGGEGNDTIYGNYGDDIIEGGKGEDKLNGGYGSDTYFFAKGDGEDVIENYDSYSSSEDSIVLRADILRTILERDGNNLDITYLDRDDKITVKNWYSGSDYQVDKIRADEDYIITNKRVNLLIEAMAVFEKNNNVDWKSAIESNDEKAINILEQFWVKQD